ncbi:MAG: hypothetical protein IJJ26_13030 [Victivallales bacterium]|nr:hypothetical protein [Victivallales bacterium]
MLKKVTDTGDVRLYQWASGRSAECFIASTPQTRAICNDTTVLGTDYTDRLRTACRNIFQARDFSLQEDSTVVVNILRGGLNFGLREALSEAYGWKKHTTCFISAQRARNTSDPEEWHITENAYRKLYFPREASFVIGDVVATGTSLQYALSELLNTAERQKTALKNIVFFTFGGPAATDILSRIDQECRIRFPGYTHTTVIFFEGCFQVPDLTSTLAIRLTGTDLLRLGAIMAPDFIESQYDDPAFPIERCAIYDAGSRAFWVCEYAEDVRNYWKQVLDLAEQGMDYDTYLHQRFPELDASRFHSPSLREIAIRQINLMS